MGDKSLLCMACGRWAENGHWVHALEDGELVELWVHVSPPCTTPSDIVLDRPPPVPHQIYRGGSPEGK